MIRMIELPYAIDALEPYYDRETLAIHYDTLYRGYVDNTNKTEEKLKEAREKGNFENIKCLEKDLSFYDSGSILHKLFFENMGPENRTMPSRILNFGIEKTLAVLRFLKNNSQKVQKLSKLQVGIY